MNKRIAIVGTNGLPGRYGGWDQLLEHLTKILGNNYDIVVFKSKNHPVQDLKEYNGVKLYTLPFKANGAQSVIYDIYSIILSMLWRQDLLLVLGTSGCICFPILKALGIKTILNPDGAEWKRTKWNYFIQRFLYFSDKLGVKYATRVISDNLIIQEDVELSYSIKSELIPYGGDHVIVSKGQNEFLSSLNLKEESYAFKVCRIVPENNLDMILEAFTNLDLILVIVGNWENSKYGIDTKSKFSNYRNILLLDPIYDQKKLDSLRSNCRYYIHGHSVGGTNPSLVEAMYLGLCCIVFDVNYNRVTTNNLTNYFQNSIEISNVVKSLEENNSERERIAKDLKEYAKANYTWSTVIKEYKRVIDEVLKD